MRGLRATGLIWCAFVCVVLTAVPAAAQSPILEASYAAPMGHVGSWSVSVDRNGGTHFSESGHERSAIVSKEDMQELTRIIRAQRFGELARVYGRVVEDGPRRWMRVSNGKGSNEVALFGDPERDSRTEEVLRTVAVWEGIVKLLARKGLVEPGASGPSR